MGNILVPGDLKAGYIDTGHTPEAAALRALGCVPIKGAECVVNHDKLNPYNSGRGQVRFAISASSSTWRMDLGGKSRGYPAADLRDAFNGKGDPSVALDELVEKVPDPELRAKIKNALPLAIAQYMNAYEGQRRDCMEMIHKSPHFAIGRNRQGRKFAINVRNQATARKWEC